MGRPTISRLRLDAAIEEASEWHERWVARAPDASTASAAIRHRTALLDRARTARDRREHFLAWDCLFQLDRLTLDDRADDELTARLASARAEAVTKLRGWRKAATDGLLAWLDGAAPASRERTLAGLRELTKHLHQQSQNQYAKLAQVTGQTAWACGLLVVAIAVALGLAYAGQLSVVGPTIATTLVCATFAGLLGGIMSLALGAARADPSQAIPALRLSFELAFLRPLFGAGAAIVVAFALEAGVIASSPDTRVDLVLLLGFVAGFSERWFLGFIENKAAAA